MTMRLTSVSITDFRSIRSEITIPLDAPVVLLHGPNGAGKTSILSAIELALTGEIPAFARVERNYAAHLVHRDARSGSIRLSIDRAGGVPDERTIVIERGAIAKRPILEGELARFYGERCYLAQSTLSRLLEIYQQSDATESGSPLTKFVKDLLGLDLLDALVDGLHMAGDLRRLKRAVPEYREANEREQSLSATVQTHRARIIALENDSKRLRSTCEDALRRLLPDGALHGGPSVADRLGDAEAEFEPELEEGSLAALARARRELAAMREEWEAVSAGSDAHARRAAELEDQSARAALAAWRREAGRALEAIIADLRAAFAELPSPASTDPEYARVTAESAVSIELERCASQLATEESRAQRLRELEYSVERGVACLAVLDEQLSEIANDTGEFAHALSQMVRHLRGDDCPVCGRDYAEVSSQPLRDHVLLQVANLTERAGRLQALTSERANAVASLDLTRRERDGVAAVSLSQEALNQLRQRRGWLADAAKRLGGLRGAAVEGAALLRRCAQSAELVAELRQRDERIPLIRRSLAELAAALARPVSAEEVSADSILKMLEEYVHAEETIVGERQGVRRSAFAEWQRLREVESRLSTERESLHVTLSQLEAVGAALKVADAGRQRARALASSAQDARTAIVRRVFNESLNATWRDLFVRLAPEEPFIPAFALPPESSGAPIEAALETVYRGLGGGGSPGAVLSAGNLNTAALTLFLALHLSVEAKLPLLVLDDPVQNMDEVHVSQFAALLRTLSKGQGRQIVIAVHEKPLFDYLALELSPSFEGDMLTTVELGRAPGGNTIAEVRTQYHQEDRAVA